VWNKRLTNGQECKFVGTAPIYERQICAANLGVHKGAVKSLAHSLSPQQHRLSLLFRIAHGSFVVFAWSFFTAAATICWPAEKVNAREGPCVGIPLPASLANHCPAHSTRIPPLGRLPINPVI
jgi:hypothetical protein